MNRPLKIVLAISLILNVFLICAVGSSAYVSWRRGATHLRRGGSLARGGDDLLPADRTAFNQMLIEHLHASRPLIQDGRAARRAMLDALAAPTFDRTATEVAMDRARDDDMKVRTALETAVLDFAARLDPQERVALAAGIRHGAAARWGAAMHPDGRRDQPPVTGVESALPPPSQR